jgi:hypothetical protein
MHYQISAEVVWTDTGGDEVRLYDSARGDFLTLNSTGAEIWRLAADGRTTAEITSALGGKYADGNTRHAMLVEQETVAFLDSLVVSNLLTRTVADPAGSRE